MSVLGGAQRDRQRLCSPERYLDLGCPAQIQQRQIVGGHLFGGDVSGGRRDAGDIGPRVRQQIQQCQRIVDSGVDVHHDRLPHDTRLSTGYRHDPAALRAVVGARCALWS